MTYLVDRCSMPFCKGCGHTHVIRKLNEALVSLNLDPQKINLVTDIGCIGLADGLFADLHTVHTTHGRSTAFATGIELADSVLGDSRLKTIVLIGDGGAMIGLLHLVNAALLNVDVTVLVCNNFLFGMTGGQNSSFSPIGFNTPTTPGGNIVPPADLCGMLAAAHAGFIARKFATDHDLAGVIGAAISHPGFSVVEIIELCTEHGTSRNKLSGADLKRISEEQGQQTGLLRNSDDRPEFGPAYRKKHPDSGNEAWRTSGAIVPRFQHSLNRKLTIVLAGSAGEKVQSAAGMFCEAAALSNLHATQKNDNPVTQGSGFSLAEICLSPDEIHYTGIDTPDVIVVVSADGLKELEDRNLFSRAGAATTLITDDSLSIPSTPASMKSFNFRKTFGADRAAAAALMHLVATAQIFPPEALEAVFARKFSGKEAITTRILIDDTPRPPRFSHENETRHG